MRIEKLLVAATLLFVSSAGIVKIVGLRMKYPGLERLSGYLLAAGVCVSLLPLCAFLLYLAYATIKGRKDRQR
jgi:hypothetical protein